MVKFEQFSTLIKCLIILKKESFKRALELLIKQVQVTCWSLTSMGDRSKLNICVTSGIRMLLKNGKITVYGEI